MIGAKIGKIRAVKVHFVAMFWLKNPHFLSADAAGMGKITFWLGTSASKHLAIDEWDRHMHKMSTRTLKCGSSIERHCNETIYRGDYRGKSEKTLSIWGM